MTQTEMKVTDCVGQKLVSNDISAVSSGNEGGVGQVFGAVSPYTSTREERNGPQGRPAAGEHA